MSKYIECVEGDVGIVLSISHGGLEAPESIPSRRCICPNPHDKCPVIIKNDGFTIDLGRSIATSISEHLGQSPYVVINHLERSKLDPNREIGIAAQDNEEAIEAFNAFHGHLERIKAKLKRGLLIDIHGQCSVDGVIELGYCIAKSKLKAKDFKCATSSIAKLASENNDDLIAGQNSLGAFIEKQGLCEVVPSPSHPVPGDFAYYSGGYITKRYGRDDVDAIQVETPRDLRIEAGEEGRDHLGHALGSAISDFYKFHYVVATTYS